MPPSPENRPAGRAIVLEPYFGGSHRAFLEGMQCHLPYTFDFLTLPARGWKWRMRLASPYFARELRRLFPDGPPSQPCCLLCSTFVDVATLKGLLPEGWQEVPVCTYFHENQFAYPVQVEDVRDLHFGITNCTTALASDRLAFNSSYNLDTFVNGCGEVLAKAPDMDFTEVEEALRAKSVVLPPPQDFSAIDAAESERKGEESEPVVVWNHRWEHDKNPERFFAALFDLDQAGVYFKLVVLGQSFRHQPPVFADARERLAHRLLHFGTAESRQEYIHWLKRGDLVVSTAIHEFFGIAVLEAVRAGCRPLLPARLSYPELFPKEFLYREENFALQLETLLREKRRLTAEEAYRLTAPFSWTTLAHRYRDWLFPEAK